MKRASTGENPVLKRAKSTQACASCRRQKSRCEILDVQSQSGTAPATIRCHRCKSLGVVCSFETSDLIHILPKTTIQTAPAATSPTVAAVSRSPQIYAGLNTLAAVASSSRPNADALPPIPGRYDMQPEDLLPTATTPGWGSLSRVDWTATPMLAIQELVRCPRTDSSPALAHAERLEDILSPPEITSLLEIFETRYSPWLCAQPEPVERTNSLLDLVRCTIASRHLEPGIWSVVAPRLQKLTEDVFAREIFKPQPPIESIKALLILSVWAPICGTGAEARDGRLLIASAVSMAMNLHLQNEARRALGLRDNKDGLSPDKQIELDESTRRWRLWMYLSISESMLCIGTGRAPVSQISQPDYDMTSLTTLPGFNLSIVRDVRLGLSAKMFQKAEIVFKTRLKSAEELRAFSQTITRSMVSMDDLGRFLTPLPIVGQHDAFYFQMLVLQYHSCRLLMLHHVLRETRTVHERDTPLIPWYEVRADPELPEAVAIHFGRIALASAEAVLTAFLTPSDLTQLSTAPDNLYVMVCFAATWLFVTNFSIYHVDGGKIGGASERLQAMTIDRLNQISHSSGHSAARCGHVLGALLRAWERRPRALTKGCHYVMDIPYESPSFAPAHEPTENSNEHSMPPHEEFASPNSDLFMDHGFWASFVENLNSDPFNP